MNCHNDFENLMVNNIIPFHALHGNWKRLDGQNSGGNRKVFACFIFKGKRWKIHSDTHFDELINAYNDIINENDPFIIVSTRNGNNQCIELRNDLAKRPKHIYIYE